MKSADKILIGIVIAILMVVVAAFVFTLTRPEETYLPEDTPENIVHNYLLALQQEDYARAYTYLSPTLTGYPRSAITFERDITRRGWVFRQDRDVSVSVEGATIEREEANVEVLETRFYGSGLFDSGQSLYTFKMDLTLIEGQWKITGGEAYFSSCWQDPKNYGCSN